MVNLLTSDNIDVGQWVKTSNQGLFTGIITKLYYDSDGAVRAFDLTWSDGLVLSEHTRFSDFKLRLEPVADQVSTINQSQAKMQETPCGVCTRMNDVGVKTCWCCGNKP